MRGRGRGGDGRGQTLRAVMWYNKREAFRASAPEREEQKKGIYHVWVFIL
jgi:hypothetical protein